MDGNGKLYHEAQKRGYASVAEMVADFVAKKGTRDGAAAAIGVAPNALYVWMQTNGYVIEKTTSARLVRVEASDELEPA